MCWSRSPRCTGDSDTSASKRRLWRTSPGCTAARAGAVATGGLEGRPVGLSDGRFLAARADAAGLPESSKDGFFIILDNLDKIGWDGVRSELEGLGLPSSSITAALDKIAVLQG